MKMGLREANQNFSKAIRAIKQGKTIVLTERGEPFATIRPIERTDNRDELQELRDDGFLIPRVVVRPRKGAKPLRIPNISLSGALRLERDEE